jgi:uncharacterized membrane protein (DUF373 family)
MRNINTEISRLFDATVKIVFGIILLFIILAIAIGTLQLFITTWDLLAFKGITGHYIDLIADVLTLYVLIELARSLVEYFSSHKLRLTFIVDAAIVFVIREILIALFKHEIKVEMLYALSAFLFVLGALRIASVLVYHKEKELHQR